MRIKWKLIVDINDDGNVQQLEMEDTIEFSDDERFPKPTILDAVFYAGLKLGLSKFCDNYVIHRAFDVKELEEKKDGTKRKARLLGKIFSPKSKGDKGHAEGSEAEGERDGSVVLGGICPQSDKEGH